MSWNGAGTFNRLFSWVADAAAGIDIIASRMDADSDDITSDGFGNCLTRDGQGSASANLPMNGHRHTGVGNGVARTDYAALGQLQDGTINWAVNGGSADALTATYSPALTGLFDGQLCFVRAVSANATTTPTFSPNGLTAHVITKLGGSPLTAGDIPGNLAEIILRYNFANTRWELLNPAVASSSLDGIPVGALVPFTGTAAPNSNFVLPSGQAISRTTYAAYFAMVSTTYGSGDGSTTFNVIDMRGRIAAGKDNMGGSAANRIGTVSTDSGTITGTTLGSAAGSATHTVTTSEAAQKAVSTGTESATHTHDTEVSSPANGYASGIAVGASSYIATTTGNTTNTESATHTHSISGASASSAMSLLNPMIITNYLLRVA